MATDEGGLRNQRIEFVRESTVGVFPDDPAYNLYSDVVTSVEWSPSPGTEERRGVGSADPTGFFSGPEEHEVTVEYDLQQFPVDGSGDPLDASGDGVIRDADNDLPNTHSLMVRETNSSIPAGETVNGSTSKDTRLYLVGFGGRISDVTYGGDPSSDQPITVSLTYTFEKVREYQIDQPGSSQQLELSSVSANDNMDVTIEDEGAGTTETITLNGTTTVTTTASFDDIDAIEIASDHEGDIVVTGSSSGDDLAVIRGQDYYGHGEGDLGVRDLGSGSHASAIGSDYETILDDTLERPGSTAIAYEINSVEFTVSNDLATREQIGTPRMAISAGNRTVEVSATVIGPTESVQNAEQALGTRQQDVVWTLDGGTLTADNAPLTDFGGVTKTAGEAAMSIDNTFQGESVTATNT